MKENDIIINNNNFKNMITIDILIWKKNIYINITNENKFKKKIKNIKLINIMSNLKIRIENKNIKANERIGWIIR